MSERFDAIVIGSGFGGAVIAARLAEAGNRVAVLERGRRWGKADFPRTTGQVSKAFWQDQANRGFLEYRAFKRIDVIQGVGVGGGSLHYFNVHLRAPATIFSAPRWPARLTRAVLDPYYDRAEKILESRPLTPPAGLPLPPRTRVFMDAAQRAGKSARQVEIGVYTGPERTHPLGGNVQSACVYCGNCLLGCHVHAKNTLDFTYLGLAERRHGAQVFPLHLVESIEPAGEAGYKVAFRKLDAERPSLGTPGVMFGRRVVVAAGTLGSVELLLRCRDVARTLPEIGPALGQGFSGNGDMLFAGAARTREAVEPGFGPSITARADCSTAEHLITVEDLGLPDPFFWFLEGALPPRRARLMATLRLVRSYLAASLGLGTRYSPVSAELDGLLADGHTARVMPFLGMGTDAADGTLSLRDGAIDIEWSHRKSRAMFRQMERAMAQISRAAGGKYTRSVLWRWPFRKLLTAHPLGGCAPGDDRAHSVVNHHGEVWGYPGLYVVDGSIVPSALAVNPSLTIAALAERAAFWMLHGREMSAGGSS